ncbi:MAG: hypothetical protein KAJ48_09450, partial [Elusimicrobiales bacterium]|nr:hypothetical protein [Elusimicrobiales bacterium]
VGDTVTVKIREIDDQGRVNLTMLGQKENEKLWINEKGKEVGGFSGGGNSRFGNSRPPRRPFTPRGPRS